MQIGELARQAGVSVQTVRFYERRRLLPKPDRTRAGYRQYRERDLEIVRTIKRLQRFGCTLQEVRRVLELYALPSNGSGRVPYPRGSHECLREVADLGVEKLKAIDEQIHALVAIRDDLMKALTDLQAKLPPARKQTASTRSLKAKSKTGVVG